MPLIMYWICIKGDVRDFLKNLLQIPPLVQIAIVH